MRAYRKPQSSPREGFTLIELMITISIIALLIGLIVPAYHSVQQKARKAEVTVDIKSLSGALAAFKARYLGFPPSSITIHSTAAGWNGDPHSKRWVKKFWPQFNFNGSGGLGLTSGSSETLNGAECLVFFLGGVSRKTGNDFEMLGFSNNPAAPFSKTGTSRVNPFIEFKVSRLIDADNDGFPEYLDPLPGQTQPYLYFSAYEGAGGGYKTAEVTFAGMTDVYRQTHNANSPAWNSKTYQIISPGFDATYGEGGHFGEDDADADLSGTREGERDNITNFSGGTLAD